MLIDCVLKSLFNSKCHTALPLRSHIRLTLAWSVLATMPCAAATGALYLIAGIPAGSQSAAQYEAELYKVEPGHPTILVRRLATDKDGILFLLPDYKTGVIAVGKPYPRIRNVELIWMRAPETVFIQPIDFSGIPTSAWVKVPSTTSDQRAKEGYLKLQPNPEYYMLSERLVDEGSRTLLAMRLIDTRQILMNSDVEVGLPLVFGDTQASLVPLGRSHPAGVRSHGESGFLSLGDHDTAPIQSLQGVWSFYRTLGLLNGPLALPSPPAGLPAGAVLWRLRFHDNDATLIEARPDNALPATDPANVNTSQVLESGQFRLYRAATGQWTTHSLSARSRSIRHIDHWIMGVMAEDANGRHSPGAENLRPIGRDRDPHPRPITQYSMNMRSFYYPGKLFAISTDSGKMWTIDTGQADSEMLLVQDNTVYYRVNDAILQRSFQGDGFSAPIEIARAEQLRDVHVAFIGR